MVGFFLDSIMVTVFFMLCMLAFAMVSIGRDKKRLRSLATERMGEDIGTFAWKIDFRRLDTKVIRSVYEELHGHLATWIGCDLPLRPHDQLEEDLQIGNDDLVELSEVLAERSERTLDHLELNPYYNQVNTVADLIEFFCAQPKLASLTNVPPLLQS